MIEADRIRLQEAFQMADRARYFICPCCASNVFSVSLHHGPVDLVRCGSCGVEMFWPLPPERDLAAYYAARNPFTDQGAAEANAYLADPTPIRGWAQSLDDEFRRHGIKPGARVVELGCMYGTLGLELGRLGYEAWGIEPSRDGVGFINSHGGLGYAGTIFDEACPVKSCDAVLSFHVFEHLRDPYAALRKLHGMMPSGGLLHFVVPHWGGLVARQQRQAWKWFTYPEHLHYYSIETLPGAVEQCGFDIETVRTPYRQSEAAECFDAFAVAPKHRTPEAEAAIGAVLAAGQAEALEINAVRTASRTRW